MSLAIANAIYDGSFEQLPAWGGLLNGAKRLHLLGLVSAVICDRVDCITVTESVDSTG